jgi:glycosyltransferase involved in cell wall biosynthesis
MTDVVGHAVVTVITRTKDRPLFLERAIRSVFSQTYTDFRLIVVNDGGDAAAVDGAVRREAGAASSRLEVVHHAVPLGRGAGMVLVNQAARNSKSTYVVVHDDDDTWHPSFLELSVRRLEETGAMGVIATTDMVVERVENDRIVTVEQRPLYPGLQAINLYRMCLVNHAAPISFLYRRAAFDTVGYYDEELDGVSDWDFALRFLLHYDIEYLHTREAIAFYHHRPSARDLEINSVYTESHRIAENRIANRYLRDDIASGRLGLGFLLNSLRFASEREDAMFEREQLVAREQVEYLAECIRKLDARVQDLQRAGTPGARLKSDLAFLRSLPGKLLRRIGSKP